MLINYFYFKEYYKMISVNLSKQWGLDADPKAIQKINFSGKFGRNGNTAMFTILEEVKGAILDFSQGN